MERSKFISLVTELRQIAVARALVLLNDKEDAEDVKQYCKDMQISVSSYIQLCCKYCIDNVPLHELKDNIKD